MAVFLTGNEGNKAPKNDEGRSSELGVCAPGKTRDYVEAGQWVQVKTKVEAMRLWGCEVKNGENKKKEEQIKSIIYGKVKGFKAMTTSWWSDCKAR